MVDRHGVVILYHSGDDHYIEQALMSVEGYADLVLLYSTGGTDWEGRGGWQNIDDYSRYYRRNDSTKLRVLKGHALPDESGSGINFALMRNEALEYLESYIDSKGHKFGCPSSDHWSVLMLDADERVSTMGGEFMLRRDVYRKFSSADDIYGLSIRILNPHMGFDGQVRIVKSAYTRIFRLGLGLRYINRVHESIAESILDKGGRILPIEGDNYIAHLGYDISLGAMTRKVIRNIELMDRMIQDGEGLGSAWFHMGKSQCWLHNFMNGAKCFEKALEYPLDDTLKGWIREHLPKVYTMAESGSAYSDF